MKKIGYVPQRIFFISHAAFMRLLDFQMRVERLNTAHAFTITLHHN